MLKEQSFPRKVSACRAHITCLQTRERMYFQKFPVHIVQANTSFRETLLSMAAKMPEPC